MDLDGVIYTYIYNLQGDITGILDTSDGPVVEYKYDAWCRFVNADIVGESFLIPSDSHKISGTSLPEYDPADQQAIIFGYMLRNNPSFDPSTAKIRDIDYADNHDGW